MDFKKIFTNNKLLVRLIISYLITSILLTGILMGVVSNFVSSRTKTKTTEYQKDLMRQSYNTAYYALTDIYGDFYQLWSKDEDIIKGINNPNVLDEDIKPISGVIDSSVFRDELVHSVYLINKRADLVISNIDSPRIIDEFHDKSAIDLFNDFEADYDLYKDEVFFPRRTSYSLDDVDHHKDYISIVFATKDGEENLNSGIIVNIDQNRLSALLNVEDNQSSMIIANSSGKIISDSQSKNFGLRLSRDDMYNTIANNENEEDSFTEDYLGEKSFITYKKANNLGFVFISITPYSILMEEAAKINRVMAGLFIIAMFVSLIVSVISIKRIYDPLNKLIKEMKKSPSVESVAGVDEYAFLGETYKDLIIKNKRSHVSRIFNGNHVESTPDILGFSKQRFLTLAIIPDDNSYRYSDMLERIIELMEEHSSWVGGMTSNECVSFIINEDNFHHNIKETIMEELINFQGIVSNELDITISIGIGTVINSLESIKFSHRYAMLAVNYALSIGENQVIYHSEIEDSKVAASVNKDSITNRIEEYVMNNFTRQDFSAEEIAEDIELSLGYIRQIFREEKGLTLNDYIISCRINKAKELLIETEDTAKVISEIVGYYDNRYFYTIFKKKVGMTTEEFRKSGKGASG